jgi:HD-like signal output (HDOD) protein
MLKPHQRLWGVDQWAAYLSTAELPCMPRSKARLLELESERQEALSAVHLALLASTDPFLCLRLLREAEKKRVRRLEHETTTPLGAIMQLGLHSVHRLILNSPETDENNPDLAACEARSVMASQLALRWGSARADISPEEIAMAALLSEIGELLLWSFVPEIPQAAQARLTRGESLRSVQAQVDSCGFRFRDLTLKIAAIWNLPSLLTHLIRGVDHTRANLSRLCVDTARHLQLGGSENTALPSDLAEAGKLIPGAGLEWLAAQLPEIDEEAAAVLVEQAQALGAPPAH